MELLEFKSPVLVGCYYDDIWTFLYRLPRHAGVYLLTDKDRNLKYVGSSVNVRSRCASYFHPNSPAYRRILFLDINPIRLKFELLEDCNGMEIPEIRKRETWWIRKLGTCYPGGLNVNTPAKGGKLLSQGPYIKFVKGCEKVTPCYQLLKFSYRIAFYYDMVKSTPSNPTWFNQKLPKGLRESKLKLAHMKFADLARPYNSY